MGFSDADELSTLFYLYIGYIGMYLYIPGIVYTQIHTFR